MARYLRRLDPRRWAFAKRLRQSAEGRESAERIDRFLVVQHHIRDDRKQFRASLAQLRARPVNDRDAFVKAKFLPDVLEANVHFYEGDFAKAAARYRDAIAQTSREYQRIRSKRFRLRERRKLEFMSIVLAILHNNLAQALAREDPDSPKALEAFAKAIELQPSMVMLRENLANHYVNRGIWTQAEAAFRDAYASAPTSENEERLHQNLAALRWRHAEKLSEEEEKQEESIGILETSLRELAKTELRGWMGKTYFTLAGVRRRQGKTADAVAANEKSVDLYSEAGDRESASYISEVLAGFHAGQGEDELALQLLEKSRQLALGPEGDPKIDRSRHARLKSKMGILLLLLGRPKEAEQSLDESWELWHEEGWFEPFGKIVDNTREFLERDEAIMRLKLHLQRRLRQATEPWKARDLIGALRHCQEGVLKYILPPDHPTAEEMSTTLPPVVTPLVVEIDSAFLHGAGGPDLMIDSLAPAMREHLWERYGVKVPGIRVREIEGAHPYGTYNLMIHEVPLRSDVVDRNQRMYLGDRAKLDALGITSWDEARNIQGKPAFWINKPDWDRALAAGLELLVPLEVPLHDLEDLIAANLVELVGHQEVQNLLESEKLYGPDGDDIVAKEAGVHMDPLTNVVRALVSERVPITDFPRLWHLQKTLGRARSALAHHRGHPQ